MILDIIWFVLAYDSIRSIIRTVIEITTKNYFEKGDGKKFEGYISMVDVPIAVIAFILSTIGLVDEYVSSYPLGIKIYSISVLLVSLYRMYIKPRTNPNTFL